MRLSSSMIHDGSRAVIGNDHTITRQVPNTRWSPQRNFGVRGPKTARNRHRDAWRGRSEARRKSRGQGDSDDSGFPDFVTPQHSGAISSTKNIWTKRTSGAIGGSGLRAQTGSMRSQSFYPADQGETSGRIRRLQVCCTPTEFLHVDQPISLTCTLNAITQKRR